MTTKPKPTKKKTPGRKPASAKKKKAASRKPTSTKKKAAGGRPPSRQNHTRDVAHVVVSRCKKCESTEREGYKSSPTVLASAGRDPITNAAYTHVAWRRTKCLDCGQHRIDKCYENRKAAE